MKSIKGFLGFGRLIAIIFPILFGATTVKADSHEKLLAKPRIYFEGSQENQEPPAVEIPRAQEQTQPKTPDKKEENPPPAKPSFITCEGYSCPEFSASSEKEKKKKNSFCYNKLGHNNCLVVAGFATILLGWTTIISVTWWHSLFSAAGWVLPLSGIAIMFLGAKLWFAHDD